MFTRVLTFTANPLAETTLHQGKPIELGRTHRARETAFQVGGKGINVAKMLYRLGGDVAALSFAGGATGDACRQWLQRHAAYPWELVSTHAATRAGTVVREPNGRETTFLGPDGEMDAEAAAAAARRLRDHAKASVIALCGSMPGWPDASYSPLRDALLRDVAPGQLVVDTYGPALVDLVRRPLALVKINRSEFGELMQAIGCPPRLDAALATLPVRRWIITDGAKEIRYAVDGSIGQLTAPIVQEVSATGSGDVFLAAVLAQTWQDAVAWPDLLAYAAELGARNAAHPGVAEFELPV